MQFITHFNSCFGYADGARLALEGGCRWVQLRMKDASDEDVMSVAAVVGPLCRQYGATFILDDRVGLVGRVGADGVHLGKNDMPVAEARRLLGPDRIIGGTANTIDDVRRLCRDGADYIGCGPYRFTSTKKNLSPVLGLDGYRNILSEMRSEGLSLPVVAIGGIRHDDISALMALGVADIAVSGAVLNASDPVAETRLFENKIKTFKQTKRQ